MPPDSVGVSPAIDGELTPFTPTEREAFFASIARHQRAASWIGGVGTACAVVLALVVAVLMAPLLYALIGIALDLLNKVVRTPDLIGTITTAVSDTTEHPEMVPVSRWLYFGLLASLPGLVVMALAWRTLGRLMREAMQTGAAGVSTRPIHPDALSEQRFANVVAEMAIAAQIPAPSVLVADSEAVNAAAFGVNRANASIVVTTGLLGELDRAELQGVAGELVGTIANGDMKIGAHFATILGMFGLVAQLGNGFADRGAARRFMQLLLRSMRPGSSVDDGRLSMELTNPFNATKDVQPSSPGDPNKVPWRTWAWMPLVGPLVISGFFGGLICTVVLGPLLALTWRRRKYLADATAVRLTRDPDTLGRALQKMRGAPIDGAFGAWIAHLCVVPSGLIGARSVLGGSSVPMSPSLDRRLKALGLMGASVTTRATRTLPPWAWIVLAPVIALLVLLIGGVVFGLLYVSAALSGLFTWLPAVLIHAMLR